MIYAIILLTIAPISYILYRSYKSKQLAILDAKIEAEEKKVDTLKADIAETKKEIDSASKNYNDLLADYKRKFGKRD